MYPSEQTPSELIISTEIGKPKLWIYWAAALATVSYLTIVVAPLAYLINTFVMDSTRGELLFSLASFIVIFVVATTAIFCASRQLIRRFGKWIFYSDTIVFQPKIGQAIRLRLKDVSADSPHSSYSTLRADRNIIVLPWTLFGEQAAAAKAYLSKRVKDFTG